MTIDPATLVGRAANCIQTSISDCIVLMHIESGRFFSLNETASDIWAAIETPIGFASLIDRLAAEYRTSGKAIAADVGELLEGLAANGLVTLGSRP